MDEGVKGAPHLAILSALYPGGDVDAEEEALLYHLLSCSSCRERAQAALLERHGTELALPALGLGVLLDEDCDPGIPLDGILDELLARPREQHFALLDDAGLRKALLRAGLLKADARRLAGRLEEAHQALAEEDFLLAPLPELARLRRAVGLVRWEQGRLEEGAFHLEGAATAFSMAQRRAEEGETLALLGLLQAETGLLPQCTGSLLGGLRLLPAEGRPWLAALASLDLALALAEQGASGEVEGFARELDECFPSVPAAAEAAATLPGDTLERPRGAAQRRARKSGAAAPVPNDGAPAPPAAVRVKERAAMKEHVHLTPGQVDVLLSGSLSAEGIRIAVRVLLAGCPVCMEEVRRGVLGPDGLEDQPESPRKPFPSP